VPVLLFDGECPFCTASAQWLRRHMQRPVRMIPWQAAALEALGIQRASARRSVLWIEPGGVRLRAELAIARALVHCGAPWRQLGRLCAWPIVRPVSARGYRLASALRNWLRGIPAACARVEGPRP